MKVNYAMLKDEGRNRGNGMDHRSMWTVVTIEK